MAIADVRKQLKKELSFLGQQTIRIGNALQALNGVVHKSQKKFKRSAAARRRIGMGVRKARLARAEKHKK